MSGRSGIVSEMTSSIYSSLKRTAKSALTSRPLYERLKARALRQNPVTVLCYHTLRPDEDRIDAWTAVRRSDFMQQMEFVRAHYDIVSLDEAIASQNTPSERPRAVVTFDDGEQGLSAHLLPMLSDLRLPVTLYIATGQVQSGQAYWFDRVMNALQAEGAFDIDLTAKGLRTWKFAAQRGSSRWATIAEILEALKKVPPDEREMLTEAVIAQAPDVEGTFTPLAPLSIPQLQELSRSEWVTIAAHSHCHSLLDQIPPEDVTESLTTSRTLLETWTEKPAIHFAYPNGNHNSTVERIVSKLGFATAFALNDRLWHQHMNPFALPRLCIGRYDDLDRFKLRLIEI